MTTETRTTVSEYLYGTILEFDQIESFLNAITRLAVHELSDPGEEVLCGITLLRDKRAGTVASSSQEAQETDELQYEFDDGPCLTASRTQTLVEVPEVKDEGRWPEYATHVTKRGIRSIAAIPFQLEPGDGAALNLYSSEPGKFTPDIIEKAQEYARQASHALALAVRLAGHREAEANAIEAMKSRTTIDLAVGIIMGQNHCSQDEAFRILRSASSSRNIKVREIAAGLVASTSSEMTATHFDR